MSFFGYLSLIGIIGTGATSGIIYSSFKNQKPYIDRLFEEIKQDIEGSASRYPSAKEASDMSNSLNVQENLKTKEEILLKLKNIWSQLLKKHLENLNLQNEGDDTNVESTIKDLSNENEFKNIYEKMKDFVSLIKKPKSNHDNNEIEENPSVMNESPYIKKIEELFPEPKISGNNYGDIE